MNPTSFELKFDLEIPAGIWNKHQLLFIGLPSYRVGLVGFAVFAQRISIPSAHDNIEISFGHWNDVVVRSDVKHIHLAIEITANHRLQFKINNKSSVHDIRSAFSHYPIWFISSDFNIQTHNVRNFCLITDFEKEYFKELQAAKSCGNNLGDVLMTEGWEWHNKVRKTAQGTLTPVILGTVYDIGYMDKNTSRFQITMKKEHKPSVTFSGCESLRHFTGIGNDPDLHIILRKYGSYFNSDAEFTVSIEHYYHWTNGLPSDPVFAFKFKNGSMYMEFRIPGSDRYFRGKWPIQPYTIKK